MDFRATVGMAVRDLGAHRLRLVLTTSGVVIGVAAVIVFVVLSASLQAAIVTTIVGDEGDLIVVTTGTDTASGLPTTVFSGGPPTFTDDDVARFQRVDGVNRVVPIRRGSETLRLASGQSIVRPVVYTSPSFFEVRGQPMQAGRPFETGTPEVVLNEPAAQSTDPPLSVGDTIELRRGAENVTVTVVGIVEPAGGIEDVLLTDVGMPPIVYAPADPFLRETRLRGSDERRRQYSQVLVEAQDGAAAPSASERLTTVLESDSTARTNLQPGYEFRVQTQQEITAQLETITDQFALYITAIAMISLVVGAIGIANVMLFSVAERTREVAIMRAVGATRRDIVQLFLAQAVLIGILGAAVGVGLGIAVGAGVSEILGLPLRIEAVWIPVGVAMGVAAGILAGIYPAWYAARLDPIVGLRWE